MIAADSAPIRVLLVDDDADFAALTEEFLERTDEDFAVETRHAAGPALDHLADADVDCVVSDHDMPGTDGLEFLDAVRESHPELPFVLFTGKGDEEIASDAISAGVTDYIQKGGSTETYAVLANTVRNAVEKRRSERALREEKHLLEQVLATTPGSLVFQPDGRVASATDRARATLALDGDPPETPDWTFTTLDGDPLPDEDHPVRRVAETGDPVHGERLGVEWPDGWRKYLVLHCAPLFDTDGDVDRVVASFTDVTDRVEHQRAIERVQTIVQAVDDAVYTLDADGEFTFVNDAFVDLTGRDRGALVGEHCSVVFDDPQVEAGERAVASLLDDDRDAATVELTVDDWADGVEHVEARIALLPFDTGFEGTAGVVRDVTERERRERRLRESEQRYASVVENANDAVVVAQDGDVQFANPAAGEVLGVDPADLEGRPVADVVAPEDREAVLDRHQQRLAGDSPQDRYEFHALTADGERVPIEFTASRITYDGDPAVLAICRDVSERRARARERRQYETIVETAPDGVFVVDEDANYVGGNVQGAGLTGLSPSAFEDATVGELVEAGRFDPEIVPRYRETVRELLSADADDGKGKFEFHVYPEDGGPRVVECHLALRPHDGEFRGTVGVLRDVTERQRRERQLERQNERLEEFSSVVSHDLRSPLNVATGYLDRFREERDDRALDRIEAAHDRVDEILDELLALARDGVDAHDTEPVDLGAVSAAAWDSVATGDATLDVDADGATVEAARGRLQELLENLFANAVEHGSASPRSHAHEDGVEHGSSNPGSQARQNVVSPSAVSVAVGALDGGGFYVEDDGPGVPTDAREDVFEMGYTTDADGTGFGLAIVERVADTHGWDVSLSAGSEGGARFEFDTTAE